MFWLPLCVREGLFTLDSFSIQSRNIVVEVDSSYIKYIDVLDIIYLKDKAKAVLFWLCFNN